MLPVFLDLTGRLALVVGGGAVGLRKARAVRAAGGSVRLVCLEERPADWGDADLEWRQEGYEPGHLDGVAIVFAAATAEVNARVVEDARRRGIWVNVAEGPARGDFHLGASVRRGEFVIAVGTGGAAPGLARRVREQLEGHYDEAYGIWVSLLSELRPDVLRIPDEATRRAVFERLTDWQWLARIRDEGIAATREAMRGVVTPPERATSATAPAADTRG